VINIGFMKSKELGKNIFIILGPTSSGKTSLALDMCKRFNGEIVSADSRQVFKFMDIGTGKVPVRSKIKIERVDKFWILDGIKVWGYDLTTPDQYFSGYDFANFSLTKAREIIEDGKSVFLVGGTGFYIDLFTGKMKPSKVKPDLEFRKSLEILSLSELQSKLKSLNSKAFAKIDQKNKVRLIRAVEKELSVDTNEESLPYLEGFNFIHFGLSAPKEFFYKRADSWVEEIWNNGLVNEVTSLLDRGYGESTKLRGLVYKTVLDLLDKKISENDAIQRIKFDIHAYIRRQLTWFKKNKKIEWVDISKDDFKEIIYNKIKEKI